MSQPVYRYHAKNPANQPFQLGSGIKNKTKVKAWWQSGSSNNKRKKQSSE